MRLRQIQDFLAVIELGSIHAAARKLGLSQPTVTKSIRGLEAELHVQLVQRTNHGVVPTPAGLALYVRARAADAELRKAKEELAQLGGSGAGSTAFGVGPLAAILVVPDAVTRFRSQFPTATVRILEGYPSALLPLVRDATLDFAMGPRVDSRFDSDLTFRPLFREEFIVVGRKGHPQRTAGSLARLDTAAWVGGLMSFELADGIDCFDFLNTLEIVVSSSNLADNRTLAIPVANTIYFEMGAERRASMGIAESMIRVSTGIEDEADLIADFRQALG